MDGGPSALELGSAVLTVFLRNKDVISQSVSLVQVGLIV